MNNLKGLNPNDALFNILSVNPPKWWENLISDDEVNIEIRKDNYIDVYYLCRNIIMRLQYSKHKSFSGSIHREYIPLESKSHSYIKYILSQEHARINSNELSILELDDFSKAALDKIKKRIKYISGNASEKYIQAKFIQKDPFYIDSEFQITSKSSEIDNEDMRIDLVRVDRSCKKLVFIELKTIGDKRLFDGEIEKQLNKYKSYIHNHKDPFLYHFNNVFNIKRKLGLLPKGLKDIHSLEGYELAEKPLLLLGDCDQEWIDSNSQKINEKIKHVALGCYYFGSVRLCDLVTKTIKNRYIF